MARTGDERQTSVADDEVVIGTTSGPIRMCVGCRVRRAQGQLLRFGLQPGDARAPAQITPRLGARSFGGRSAYLCPRRDCLERAVKRRVFTRAFTSTRGKRGARSATHTGNLSGSSDDSLGSIGALGPAAADALWTGTIDILRREIDLLDRVGEKTHADLRRRGFERLLFELSSQPAPSDRRSSANRPGGTPTHG
jgi:predicted RNA-binding protein YlxR (DUF448 family)